MTSFFRKEEGIITVNLPSSGLESTNRNLLGGDGWTRGRGKLWREDQKFRAKWKV